VPVPQYVHHDIYNPAPGLQTTNSLIASFALFKLFFEFYFMEIILLLEMPSIIWKNFLAKKN